eukprot:TRINITY_DN1217_c0_g1_i2.p1 TRINITY_DN1217_c0_g1~~TRINITY_DN1217_c0_g1_i2.p1  ORF type:complete len:248 (+),score=5.38 TRINITY_DN1217_c0_g1_i2:842-1585(+)
MKKLMTACAACMIAGLVSAEVTSQVVGYQTINLPIGYKDMTITFVPVGSDATQLRLGDIAPANFSGDNGDSIQFFNPSGNGSVVKTATYYADYGWCNPENTEEMLDDYTIVLGSGMFVYASQVNAQFTIAGQVNFEAFNLDVPAGYTVVGNSSPVVITLGDIVPTNFSGDNGDSFQFFHENGNGTVVKTATYYADYGWCNPENTEEMLDDEVLNPGDAVFAYSQNAATYAFPQIPQRVQMISSSGYR